ncbi:MAG: hypothetical protein RIS79_3552 [Verrucomicrobiota bacterium]|jgi:hypothetical protein
MNRSLGSPRFSRRRNRRVWGGLLLVAVVSLGGWTIWRVQERVNASAAARIQAFSPEKRLVIPPAASQADKTTAMPPSKPKPAPPFDEKSVMMPVEARQEYEQACGVLREAFAGGSSRAMESSVRHPDLTMPRVRALPSARRVVPSMPLEIGPKFGTSGVLLLTTLRLADGSHRPVAMEKKNGRYLLDWESLTGWCEASFTELLARPSGKTVLLRAHCSPSSAKAPYGTEKGLALVLSHPAETLSLSAFAAEDLLQSSEAGKALAMARDTPFTLRVMADTEHAPKGWARVVEVVCTGWVTDS